MNIIDTQHQTSDFLITSTFIVCVVALVFLFPFAIYALIQKNYMIAFNSSGMTALACVNAYLCQKGRFYEKLNIVFIAPFVFFCSLYVAYALGIKGTYWSYLTVVIFYLIMQVKWASLFSIALIFCLAYISSQLFETKLTIRFIAVLVGFNFFIYFSLREINQLSLKLKKQAYTDSLTRVYNRKLLQGSLEKALKKSKHTDNSSFVIMLDLDNFKQINDTYGHNTGDEVLVAFCKIIKKCVTPQDFIFRIGGEEFLILLQDSNLSRTKRIAEDIRTTLMQTSIINNHTVTTSIGIANAADKSSWKEWIKKADEHLYLAKTSGRNTIISSR